MKSTMNKQGLLTLEEVFEDRLFIIPSYQRGYSWGKSQRADLLSDIENARSQDFKHFTGTLVAAQNGQSDELEIVDGQQRLTSLLLLINVILKNALDIDAETKLKLNERFNYRKSNTGLRRVFRLGNGVDEIYEKEILQNVSEYSLSDSKNKSWYNIIQGRDDFKKWVETKYKPGDLETILQQFGFLLFIPQKSDTVGVMFEVINNRGKQLSELEKIKNYLIYYSIRHKQFALQEKIKSTWQVILENLMESDYTTNDEENAFLRYCWILFETTDKNRSHRVYEGMKECFRIDDDAKSSARISDFLDLLRDASKALLSFTEAENPSIEQLKYHNTHASIMPLFLSIMIVHKHNGLSVDRSLEFLEKMNFRVYVLPQITSKSNKGQGDLFFIAHKYFYENYPYKKRIEDRWFYPNYINTFGELQQIEDVEKAMLIFTESLCTKAKMVEALTLDLDEDYDYYSWPGLKYLLATYEIDLNTHRKLSYVELMRSIDDGFKPDDLTHREHLWAKEHQTPGYDNNWSLHEKRRLGNFALLEGGINSSGQNDDIEEKLILYFDPTRSSNLQMVKDLLDEFNRANTIYEHDNVPFLIAERKPSLYSRFIDLREEKLVNWALNKWKLPFDDDHSVKINSFQGKQVRHKGFISGTHDNKIYRLLPAE